MHPQSTKQSPQPLSFSPIGTIYTPYKKLEDMPIQPKGAQQSQGSIELSEQYREGIQDLTGFSHLYLLYHFHQAKRTELTVTPFMDTSPRGVFATRSPLRPNHIGISIVELVEINGCALTIRNVDILNETPLLDIKPYIENFDTIIGSRSGWMTASVEEVAQKRSDRRFAN